MRTHTLLAAAALAAAAALVTSPILAGEGPVADAASPVVRAHSWLPETVKLLEELPVQDDGRIKPLRTVADFQLLKIRGTRSHRTPDGVKVKAAEWLLDVLFHPEHAKTQEVFTIADDAVLHAVGLGHEGKKRRDRYAYFELEPAFTRIMTLAQEYAHVEAQNRDTVQQGVLTLATNMRDFAELASFLDFARRRYPTAEWPERLTGIFGGRTEIRTSDAVAASWQLHGLRLVETDGHQHGADTDVTRALDGLLKDLSRTTFAANRLALFPAPGTADARPTWMSPASLTEQAFTADVPVEGQIEMLGILEDMTDSADDPAAFHEAAKRFHDASVALATGRGEYEKVPVEVAYYRADLMHWSLLAFGLAFLLTAWTWTAPRLKAVVIGSQGVMWVALALATAGITMRCIIRSRPPVSTLYETILFVTAVGVLVALISERIGRRGISRSVGAVLGFGGMFLANRYEMHEAKDTMPNLVAVLDTNFWLATHVTTVTIGYSAGILAALISHVYVGGSMFGLERRAPQFMKSLTRTTYGVLCFGLLFSVVGTILGGIWANDSWGRFWGWDPKENGALLICLWELIILHARMGGYIRDFGLAVMSIIGGLVVVFSWWGVNLLGIGLHSYGFTTGVMGVLLIVGSIEGVVLLAAGVHGFLRSRAAGPTGATPTLPPGVPV